MPAKDRFHNAVRHALEKDGWTITHDPFTISIGRREVYIDLGAERVIAAEKGNDRIAVEVKTFDSSSDVRDLENAIGQYSTVTRFRELEEDRRLILAVSDEAFKGILAEPIATPVLEGLSIALVVFDPKSESIVRWTN